MGNLVSQCAGAGRVADDARLRVVAADHTRSCLEDDMRIAKLMTNVAAVRTTNVAQVRRAHATAVNELPHAGDVDVLVPAPQLSDDEIDAAIAQLVSGKNYSGDKSRTKISSSRIFPAAAAATGANDHDNDDGGAMVEIEGNGVAVESDLDWGLFHAFGLSTKWKPNLDPIFESLDSNADSIYNLGLNKKWRPALKTIYESLPESSTKWRPILNTIYEAS